MNQLTGSFFDEVDDFIFGAGKRGQLAEGGDYLGAMREIRAKQVLFEETFLDAASSNMEVNSAQPDSSTLQSRQNSGSPIIFESMEIELAVSTMTRKAIKYYSPYIKQIEELVSAIEASKQKHLVSGNTLISSVIGGFVEAQDTIKMSLEIRLVFMKLFEQHFLMEMEKLFLDSISILNNIDNKQFVDKLYSSSSSFHVPVASSCTPSKTVVQKPITDFQQAKSDSKAVESSVEDVLQIVRSKSDLPDFVKQMLEEHWRLVLLLIGLNKGVASLEWQEAEHVFRLLLLCSTNEVETSKFDESLLIEKISQGLRLLRMPTTDEEQFINALKNHLSGKVTPLRPSNESSMVSGISIQPEATVSPSGESILNVDDLNEIVQIISGESINDQREDSEEKTQLLDCLSCVDNMSACSSVKMLIKGKLHNCIATKSGEQDAVFVISNAGSNKGSRNIAVTRSRLGLAISLQRGEILLSEGAIKPAACNVTVFERKS